MHAFCRHFGSSEMAVRAKAVAIIVGLIGALVKFGFDGEVLGPIHRFGNFTIEPFTSEKFSDLEKVPLTCGSYGGDYVVAGLFVWFSVLFCWSAKRTYGAATQPPHWAAIDREIR